MSYCTVEWVPSEEHKNSERYKTWLKEKAILVANLQKLDSAFLTTCTYYYDSVKNKIIECNDLQCEVSTPQQDREAQLRRMYGLPAIS